MVSLSGLSGYNLIGGIYGSKAVKNTILSSLKEMRPIIIVNASDSEKAEYTKIAETKGYDYIHSINISHPEKSHGYNPLNDIDGVMSVDILAHTLITKDVIHNDNQFFNTYDELFLRTMLYYIMENYKKEDQNLNTLYDFINRSYMDIDKDIVTYIKKHPSSKVTESYNLIRNVAHPRLFLYSLATRLSDMGIANQDKALHDDFSLREFLNNKGLLFFDYSKDDTVMLPLVSVFLARAILLSDTRLLMVAEANDIKMIDESFFARTSVRTGQDSTILLTYYRPEYLSNNKKTIKGILSGISNDFCIDLS